MEKLSSALLFEEFRLIWGEYSPTRLLEVPELARQVGVAHILVKAEWERPLGNFKALGGMIASLRAIARAMGAASLNDLFKPSPRHIPPPRLICASDGNHGLAVTAAARRVAGKASIYLPMSVSNARVERIKAIGGDVVHVSGTYDDAVRVAADAAARGDGLLVPDTTDQLQDRIVRDVMAGYSIMSTELTSQIRQAPHPCPSHLFVQAGVGGLAATIAKGLQEIMHTPGSLFVVEPDSAACVAHALSAGRPERIDGNLHTSAEMLSCGLASAPAVEVLRNHDAQPVLVSENELRSGMDTFQRITGFRTTRSGAAGFAGLLHVAARPELRVQHHLDSDSTVLLIITEGPTALS